jgi:hypothetical protein
VRFSRFCRIVTLSHGQPLETSHIADQSAQPQHISRICNRVSVFNALIPTQNCMDVNRPIMPRQQPVGTKDGVQCFAALRLSLIVSATGPNNISDTLSVRIVLMRMP